IRDGHVTGVQTCALPIYYAYRSREHIKWSVDLSEALRAGDPACDGGRVRQGARHDRSRPAEPGGAVACPPTPDVGGAVERRGGRSEERRVGKEWRCGGWR